MITWITASHDQGVLMANLQGSLPLMAPVEREGWADPLDPDVEIHRLGAGADGDRLVIVRGAPSIAVAYNEGQRWAGDGHVRAFVHHDVQITNLPALRALLAQHCLPNVGLVGVVGSGLPVVVPWWDSPGKIGSVIDARMGRIGPGGAGQCAVLDGLLLATGRDDVVWDTRYPGWHMYDHDQCMVQLDQGRANYCLPEGHTYIRHNTTNSSDVGQLEGWDESVRLFAEKWGWPRNGTS